MKRLICLLLLETCSFGENLAKTDAEFLPIIREFEAHYRVKVNFPVTRAEINEGGEGGDLITLGVCYYAWGGTPVKVHIAPIRDVYLPSDIWLVVWHELAHCALGLDHYDKELDIMNSNAAQATNLLSSFPEAKKTLLKALDSRVHK